MKCWNRALLALVVLFLILAIIATVNIIIKQYSTEKMVFGSWSDWFNTAGTLGTFAIAAMAYRKAPDWFKQKTSETALMLAIKLRDDIELCVKNSKTDHKKSVIFIRKFDENPTADKCYIAGELHSSSNSKINAISALKDEIQRIENNGIKIINKDILMRPIELCIEFYACSGAIYRYQRELLDPEQSISLERQKEMRKNLFALQSALDDIANQLKTTAFDKIFTIS